MSRSGYLIKEKAMQWLRMARENRLALIFIVATFMFLSFVSFEGWPQIGRMGPDWEMQQSRHQAAILGKEIGP
jgi:hypothetical protein